jgi:Protein of unknown function (DUF3386)
MTKALGLSSALVLLTVAGPGPARAGDDARARTLMEEAFNRRYRWSESFKGFSADFGLMRDGKTVKGSVKIDATKPHGTVSVDCNDEDAKKLVSETLGSTVTHTRASSFEKGFGDCSFSIGGAGAGGGTRIVLEGHRFFKDFTVKDGNIVENHGGHGEMASEVRVQQVVWLADIGKTIPRAYSFTIKNGDREQSGKNQETWVDVDGVWVPARFRMVRNVGSTAPVESSLTLENIKVDRSGH